MNGWRLPQSGVVASVVFALTVLVPVLVPMFGRVRVDWVWAKTLLLFALCISAGALVVLNFPLATACVLLADVTLLPMRATHPPSPPFLCCRFFLRVFFFLCPIRCELFALALSLFVFCAFSPLFLLRALGWQVLEGPLREGSESQSCFCSVWLLPVVAWCFRQ